MLKYKFCGDVYKIKQLPALSKTYQLMLQSWYHSITGDHFVVIFETQKVTIAAVSPAKTPLIM